ncbi:hypothetical protein [Aneurinibacillus aneurinilyticus]|jgi:hypothetical protein|uniref:hypothetical protein n=1 Tax=Aneurinibacillus aneurinilyticus TaxID=1391 RepID=UPI0023F6F425|nr:hypothetical protein [Aneurinibacillus aneurinilyticus]MCI1696806.1 hypothetical protein [Aneurinibacillus aneurinilyticus]
MKTVNDKRDFIKELSVINKNKFTLQQTKSLYLGLLYELISSREIFSKNKDLEGFLKNVFKKEYSDYLFKARPYLASRLLKDISNEYDSLKISASIKLIISYLKDKDLNSNSDSKEKKPLSSMEDDVIGWFNSISKGSSKN